MGRRENVSPTAGSDADSTCCAGEPASIEHVDNRGDLGRYLTLSQRSAHITRQIQCGKQAPASLAQVAVADEKRNASVQRLLFRLEQVLAEAMLVIGSPGGPRGQASRNTFANSQARTVNTRLDGSQLEPQHPGDILERYLGDFRKNQRQAHLRRQVGHR